MTITIKPLHLAILAAFVAGIFVAAGVAFGLSGGNDPQPAAPSAASVDVPSTASPAVEPTSTPEPTSEPEPTPEPANVPGIRSCAEIRADPVYRNPEERTFFLDNCLGTDNSAPVSGAPAAAAPSSAEATAAEKLYRDRAEGSLNVFAVKLAQYSNTPSLGLTADVLEFGAVMRRYAQEMDLLPSPPPRFKQAHDQFKASLISVADYSISFNQLDVEDEDEVLLWLDGYITVLESVIAAIDDYALVLGIDLPPGLAE